VVTIAARYAIDSFVMQLASGTSIHIEAGSLRDSLSAIVIAAPSLFTTVAPGTAGGPHTSGRLNAHLAVYPTGGETS
jgi:hypothetical protein